LIKELQKSENIERKILFAAVNSNEYNTFDVMLKMAASAFDILIIAMKNMFSFNEINKREHEISR